MMNMPLVPFVEHALGKMIRFKKPTATAAEIDKCPEVGFEKITIALGKRSLPILTQIASNIVRNQFEANQGAILKWTGMMATKENCDGQSENYTTFEFTNWSEKIVYKKGFIRLLTRSEKSNKTRYYVGIIFFNCRNDVVF